MVTETAQGARVRLVLRRRDIDHLGHVNHAKYAEFFEEPRAALLRALSPGKWVTRRIELDYLREIRLEHGEVDVTARVAAVGRRSMTLDHEAVLPDGTVAARARAVVVAWDDATRGARELTEEERAVLPPPSAQ